MKWTELGRVCTVCKEFKDWDCFSWKRAKRYKDKSPHLHQVKQPKCKSCAHLETTMWRESQTDERLKDLYLKRTYNISYVEFCIRLENQNYSCKICTRPLDTSLGNTSSNANTAVVDHCHTTGKVRGILCNECNRGLGYFKDNKMSLNNAIQYLTETETSEGGQTSCLL